MKKKYQGGVRFVDNAGRIVIPKDIRKALNIVPKTELAIEITPTGDMILQPCKAAVFLTVRNK